MPEPHPPAPAGPESHSPAPGAPESHPPAPAAPGPRAPAAAAPEPAATPATAATAGPPAADAAVRAEQRQARLLRAMPAVFVLIWSTGFVVARLGMPHAPPFKFLALRFALSLAAFVAWLLLARVPWPRGARPWAHLAVTGVLMHAGYLGGVWAAVKGGLGAGLAALIVGLQPILTALWVGARRGGVAPRQWGGLVLGFAGVALVVSTKLRLGEAPAAVVPLAVLALASITAGTLYQKRWVAACDVRSASAVQLGAALLAVLPLAALETEAIDWAPGLIVAMAWSVAVLTLGGSSLLYLLIHRGAATAVSSLMYLVPPCTALMAAALFGESLGMSVWAGLALAAAGVWLVVRVPAPAASKA